ERESDFSAQSHPALFVSVSAGWRGASAPARCPAWQESEKKMLLWPALTPALSPRRGRTFRCPLAMRTHRVVAGFLREGLGNGDGRSNVRSLERRDSGFPLPGGEGQGEGERGSDFLSVSDASAPVKEREHLARTKGFLSKL